MLVPSEYLGASALIRRDVLTPNATQQTTLIVAACYIVGIAILWCVVSPRPP